MHYSYILNLTQHPATPEQLAVGVADLPADSQARLRELLTFDVLPVASDIFARAGQIADMAIGHQAAMIGGALWLMAPLAAELRARGIEPLFAFSVRETEEQPQPDGSVRKVAVFRHRGFVPAV